MDTSHTATAPRESALADTFVPEPDVVKRTHQKPARLPRARPACHDRSVSIGRRFATALADKDAGSVRSLPAPDVDFKALTPGRFYRQADGRLSYLRVVCSGFRPSPGRADPVS